MTASAPILHISDIKVRAVRRLCIVDSPPHAWGSKTEDRGAPSHHTLNELCEALTEMKLRNHDPVLSELFLRQSVP